VRLGRALVHFDDSNWPLLVASAPKVFVIETVTELERAFDEYFRRGKRYALVFDTRPVVKLPDAKCRQRLFQWVNSDAVRTSTARWNVGTAVIVASQLARYGMTVVGWLWKPPTPQIPTTSMGEAVDRCCRMLERAGIPLGPRLSEFRRSSREVA
jgi:hypothetical protein